MSIRRINIGRRERVFLAVAIVVLWIAVRQQVIRMDERFFQASLSGVKGLVLYIVGDYSGAADAYRSHFQEAYRTERTAADPGWDALLRGDLEAAEKTSREVLEEDPSFVPALLNLGEIALEKNANDEALRMFARVLEKSPDQFDALLLTSVAHARTGAFGEAIDLMNRALRTNTVETRITSFLEALRITGDLAQSPKKARPLCLLAHYHRYLRIFDPSNGKVAVAYAKKAIESGDRPADAYLTLGIIYDKEEKRQEALGAVLKAIELDPKHGEALRWAAVLYSKRGDLLNEYRMIKAAFEAAPQDPFYITHLDHVLVEKLGDIHQASDLLQKALEIKPDNVRALDRLAYLYGFVGDYDRSMQYHHRALALEPLNPMHYVGIGFNLDRLGKTEEAIAAYREAMAIAPGRPEVHSGLAKLYYGQRRYQEALAAYELAFRLGERDINKQAELCALYHVVSRFQDALDCFKDVLEQDPRNTLATRVLPETLDNLRIRRSQ